MAQSTARPTIGTNTGIGALTGGISHGGVGVLHGDQYVNQYVTDPKASPEQIFREGMRCLAAGMRGRAEELVGQAIQRGYESQEVYYSWMLVVTSRRSPEDLTDEDWHTLRTAVTRVDRAWPADPPGNAAGYAEAAHVVADLLRAAIAPGATKAAAAAAADHAAEDRGLAQRVGALPQARRAEIEDHLRYVAQRVEREALSAEESAEIDAYRMAGDRTERVPLFFTPDPLPLQPLPEPVKSIWPSDRGTTTAMLYAAALLLVMGLVLAIVFFNRDSGGTTSTDPFTGETMTEAGGGENYGGVALVLGGSAAIAALVLLLRNAPRELRRRARQARRPPWLRERRPQRPVPGPLKAVLDNAALPSKPVAGSFFAFRARLAELAAVRFAEVRPGSLNPESWQQLTRHLQEDLADALAIRYWQAGPPEGLDWLIQLRAARTAKEWADGKVTPPSGDAWSQWRGTRNGAVLAVIALALPVLLLSAQSQGSAYLVAGLWAAAATLVFGVSGRTAELKLVETERADFADEQVRHAAWAEHLNAFRPADAELGRWLDLDQRHLLRDVLREHRMERRGVLFTFFVLEGAPDCVRAKVPNGPPRYSRYGLRLFVLTTSGVWVSTWEVDFASGTHQGRKDFVFRFDSISSVVLQTVATGHADGEKSSVGVLDSTTSGLQEVLRLVLNNQQNLEVQVENHQKLGAEGSPNPGRLRELALETSGILAGFRILAALATEGEEWFDQRRDQSRQVFLG
ncbi:hypothetical protein [Streptomyces radicis]|uniref:Uncharacterized protein n=1 Tax=Streptomyces radicis TaxID=1750517 RepID=A0A3A9W6W4_9ACTN|nr:hypothetical protein [Streptomyces radicis]RKN08925.1 hypothetical protein D7319_13350 [Streptomyces radicis]RKN22883.1 hypothetical protein D7318_15205 [Streptomyces radicis]